MAEGRMLKKRISKSRKFAALKSDKARLLYLMILPHLDAEGRTEADGGILKGTVCPYVKSITQRSISVLLRGLAETGLIILYETDGERYLELVRFDEFNRINKDKEAKSDIPAPSELQRSAIPTPGKVKLSEVKENISKEKFLDFVFLTKDEHQKLIKKFGEKLTKEKIVELNMGIGSKGYKYKSHYFTILNWARKDQPPEQTDKLCIVDRKPGYKYQANSNGEKKYLCKECHSAFTALGSSWWNCSPAEIEKIVEKGKQTLRR